MHRVMVDGCRGGASQYYRSFDSPLVRNCISDVAPVRVLVSGMCLGTRVCSADTDVGVLAFGLSRRVARAPRLWRHAVASRVWQAIVPAGGLSVSHQVMREPFGSLP